MKRSAGILLPISSLSSKYGIGCFDKAAYAFVDFLQSAGQSYWQILPLGPTSYGDSPYQSFSTFAGNPYFISLDTLCEEQLLTHEECKAAALPDTDCIDYSRLYETRYSLLRKAYNRMENDNAIHEFAASQPWLEDYALFMALKDHFGGVSWDNWTEDIRLRKEEALKHWKERLAKEIGFYQFLQYQFFRQWNKLKTYANSNNIQIIGDIPIYVAFDSADVWANPKQFMLDKKNLPVCVAGVPPDYFCPDGQLWGNPIYNWAKMKEDGYQWWQDRMSHMFSLFDGVRIDHFRGIESYWAVLGTAETAKEGKWEKGPGMELVEKIHEIQGDNMVIAEDLGDITEDVIRLVNDSGFPGMRVFQFAFLGDGDTPHLPHHYENNSVAYTGTHDNNTLLGYLWELDEHSRRRMLEYCGYTDPNWEAGYDSILRTMFASHAGLLILPIQDLLGYGSDTRLNIPGKADGNWQYRVTEDQLRGINIEKFRRLNELYKRM